MNTSGSEIKIITGNANQELAAKIAEKVGVKLSDCIVTKFSDGEISVNINETVRGCDVFVVQSTNNPVNQYLMELLIMIDALKRASAGRITAVIPYYGYARQDRKSKIKRSNYCKISCKLINSSWSRQSFNYGLTCCTNTRIFRYTSRPPFRTKLIS
ncbi:putative ribose-phosphate diphosphokinase [Intestinibacter bartlettii DSM 16795]|nr:putative ribose-phosphate diphosphokinase [Intestinibacter bartlettii DSM 16795]